MPKSTREQIAAGIWIRLFRSIEPAISAEAARAILAIKFPPEDIARAHELAAKARAGQLSQAEHEEVDVYGKLGSILGILHSIARVTLRDSSRKTRSKT